MPKRFANSTLACALAALAAGASAAPVAGAPLRFDDVFSPGKAMASVHYEARFASGTGGEHKLEAWRDGDARVKRRTDDALETYAVRHVGDAEYELTVLDLKRKLLTRIDRSNLFRIGNFTDWFDLAHGLKHPKGEYRLGASSAPRDAPKAVAACGWYELTQQGRTSRVCWSRRAQLPLLILGEDGRAVWRVTRLEEGRIADAAFRIDTRGFVRNDANQDIERD